VDLVDERREVIQALLELDCLPAGMEMFPAANEDQWTLIREVIDECDYYLVIVGGRYGSISAEGISYTEMEYDYAVEKGIPILGFIHGDPTSIPIGKAELDVDARTKLEEFRAKVMSRMTKSYGSSAELGSAVSRGLTRMIKRNPRPGWVRGDQAMTAETRAEIAELRATIADLQKEEAEQGSRSALIDARFQHGQDEITLSLDYTGRRDNDFVRTRFDAELTYTWDEIVETIGPFMIDEAGEDELRRIWNAHMLRDIENADGWEQLGNASAQVSDNAWGSIIVQLRALGMIRTGVKKRTVSDKATYWTLTPAGDAYLVRLRAIRQPGPNDD
jgi:hypothetical protein